MKDSFVLYTKIKETLNALTDEQAGKLFKAILEYQSTGEAPELDGIVQIAFIPIKQDLDANAERWEQTRKARSEAGKKSAEKRANKKEQTGTNSTNVDFVEQTGTNSTVNVNVNDNVDKEKVSSKDDTKKKSYRFSPPTVDEVRDYCREKGYDMDAERFVNFYESKGWMVGKNKMKDWKSAVRGWVSRDRAEKKPATKFSNFHERQYDDSAFLALIET